MLLSSTSLMPMQFDPFPSRIAPRNNFFVHIARSTPGSHYTDSNLSCANSTMRHQKTSKHLLPLNKLAFNTLHQTSIAQILPNGPYTHGKIIFSLARQAFPNLFPLATGVALQPNAMPPSTCYDRVIKTLSSWHTKHSKVCSPSTLHPWPPVAPRSLYI
jgi:hypothetical protein